MGKKTTKPTKTLDFCLKDKLGSMLIKRKAYTSRCMYRFLENITF